MELLRWADRSAIGVSTACLVHCLLLPLILILLPNSVALILESESFHLWLVMAALPLSGVALLMGCKTHGSRLVLLLGLLGLAFLLVSALAGHEYVAAATEKLLTAVGALFLIGAHIKNYQLCHIWCLDTGVRTNAEACRCSDSQSNTASRELQ